MQRAERGMGDVPARLGLKAAPAFFSLVGKRHDFYRRVSRVSRFSTSYSL